MELFTFLDQLGQASISRLLTEERRELMELRVQSPPLLSHPLSMFIYPGTHVTSTLALMFSSKMVVVAISTNSLGSILVSCFIEATLSANGTILDRFLSLPELVCCFQSS